MNHIDKTCWALLLAGILAIGSATVAAAENTNLKFAYWLPVSHAVHPSFVEWTESISEASDGSIQFSMFPSQQLGPAKDHYSMVKLGIADVAFINPGYTPGLFPVIAASEFPFQFSNGISGSRALDEWYRRHNQKEMKDVHYCLAFTHDPGTLHSRSPIVTIDDLSGVRVRPANGTLARFINDMGGASVHVSIPEARDALAKGVVDAVMTPWDGLTVWGMEKIATHHLDVDLYSTVFIIAINKSRYQSLSSTQREAIDRHCTPAWAERIATPWAKQEDAGREKVAALPGHQMHSLSEAQLADWRQAAEPLQQQWAENVRDHGLDAEAIRRDLVETLRKHGALYE